MKRIAARLVVLSAAAMAVSAAHAFELAEEMYLVGTAGKAIMIQSPMQIDNNNIVKGSLNNLTKFNSTQTSDKYGYKLQLGYKLTPHFAVEGGYVKLGNTQYNATYTSSTVRTITIPGLGTFTLPGGTVTNGSTSRQAEFSGWNVVGVGSQKLNDEFSVFAKAGGMRAQIKTQDSGAGFGNGSITETSWRGVLGVGVDYQYDEGIGVRAEFERFNKLGDKGTTGVMDINLLSLGLIGKF